MHDYIPPRDDSAAPTRETRADRLLFAAIEQISRYGTAAVSARTLTSATGFAASAVNHLHGTMVQLFSRAFTEGVTRTQAWLDEAEKAIAALPHSPAAAPAVLEYVISAWTVGQRPLALLYQEALAWEHGCTVAAAWTGLWRDFWLRTAASLSLRDQDGRLLHLMFESEALYHLSRWETALEAAALREHCGQFGALFLSSDEPLVIGAAELAIKKSGVLPHESMPPAATRIAEAAATVLNAGGLGRLTHRAVASQAHVTAGAVTHYFRSIDELIAAAVRGQALTVVRDLGSPVEPSCIADWFAVVRQRVLRHSSEKYPQRSQAFLATLRRPELAQAGAAIRFTNGGAIARPLTRLLDIPAELQRISAGVLSRMIGAIAQVCRAESDPKGSGAALISEIERRLECGPYARLINSGRR